MSTIKTILNEDSATMYIYLDSKETKNSLDFSLTTSLLEEVKRANSDPFIKTIVFLSAHRAFFSSGPSLSGLLEIAENQNDEELKKILDVLNELILQIYHSPKVTIVGFNGYAYGGGMNVFLGCDYRIAVERAKFIENFHSMGVTADLSSSYFLPRLIGVTRTMTIMLSGDLFSAADAKDWGLFNEVVSSNKDMKERIEKLCEKINTVDFPSIQGTKKLLKNSLVNSLESQLALESESLRNRFKHEEVANRLRATLNYSLI